MLFDKNMIEHCKVEIHSIQKKYWTENDTPKTRYVYRGWYSFYKDRVGHSQVDFLF